MDLLNLDFIVERLAATTKPEIRSVGIAADLAAVMAPGVAVNGPMAFVLEMDATPGEVREGSGPLRQVFAVTFTVLTALTVSDQLGAKALRDAKPPLLKIRNALFGWTYPGAERKTHCGASGPEDFDGKTRRLLWRQDFTTALRIQEPNP